MICHFLFIIVLHENWNDIYRINAIELQKEQIVNLENYKSTPQSIPPNYIILIKMKNQKDFAEGGEEPIIGSVSIS